MARGILSSMAQIARDAQREQARQQREAIRAQKARDRAIQQAARAVAAQKKLIAAQTKPPISKPERWKLGPSMLSLKRPMRRLIIF